MTLSATHRLAILEVIARYNHAHEFDDVEAYVACFAEDGVFQTSRNTYTGQAEIRDFFLNSGERLPHVRHWVNSAVIEGDGDRATSECYFLLLGVEDAPRLILNGRYHDMFRKADDAWKLAVRAITIER